MNTLGKKCHWCDYVKGEKPWRKCVWVSARENHRVERRAHFYGYVLVRKSARRKKLLKED